MLYNPNKTLMSIDFSLNGSAMIIGNTIDSIIDYRYFSNMKKDSENEHCIQIQNGLNSVEKLDNVICYFLSRINEVDFVILEAPSFNSMNSNSEFKGGYSIFKYLCRRLGIEYLEVSPISNKLFFTGDAKADKNKMIQTALKQFGNIIDFDNISKKHSEDVSDALSLYKLGETYLKCKKLPIKNGGIDTNDIKYFETLPLYKQQVIAKLYNRTDLYNNIVKLRNKQKKNK